MRKLTKKVPLMLSFMLLSLSIFSKDRVELTVDKSVKYQVMDGFGASDAWRFQFVGKNWPVEKREKIADLLFSSEFDNDGNPKGIGLSIWRFYMGAGTIEQGDSSGIKNEWRRAECFQSPEGEWDWTKYEGQRWFLNAAKKRGVPKFLAFPNAAPVQFSNNGKGFATKGDIRFNIKPGKLDDYSTYLVDVLEHFQNEEGITFDYLSPFNEPQWNWDNGNQEGTPALNEELSVFIKYVSKELIDRGLKTEIVAGEAGTIDHISKKVKDDSRDNQAEMLFSKSSPLYIGDLPNVKPIVTAHSYFTVWPIKRQESSRELLAESVAAIDPKIGYWQSEYCILQKNDEIGKGGKRDLGMATALYVARIIHNDIAIADAKSWQWWTAMSQCDFKDGLVYLDAGTEETEGKMGPFVESLKHDGTVRDSKLMWVLGNYSRFVRPDMIRIKASLSTDLDGKLLTTAYLDLETDKTVLVVVNLENEDITIDNLSKEIKSSYTTDKTRDLEYSKVKSGKVKIPARAVVTFI